jgi:hypothetical protein
MDNIIIDLLYVYGALLCSMIIFNPQRNIAIVLTMVVLLRLFCIGMRTSLGSDIENYTSVLGQCDLSSINAQEIFWQFACQPSAYLSDIFPYPFFWIAALDCLLFVFIARLVGLRVAALHDLTYLLSNSMGAIRQALAMKLLVLAVVLYAKHRKQRGCIDLLVLTAPLVHLAALVPSVVMKFMTSSLLVRLMILSTVLLLAWFLVDDTLLAKLEFYMQFEGFRTEQNIYASWIKRAIVIFTVFFLTTSSSLYQGFYFIGLLFAAAEFKLPEIAVRIGAYFEQFEVLLVAAPMKMKLRQLAGIWYTFIGIAYTARFMMNITTLVH